MPLRDTLLRVAEKGFCCIRFSQEILDGATRNLVKNGRMNQEGADYLQSAVLDTFPEGLVDVPEKLVAAMTNDPGDRHVLAAAVHSKSEVIVTFNLKDFKPEDLSPWSVEAQHPDVFLMDLCDLYGTNRLVQVIQEQVEDLHRRPMTMLQFLEKLQKQVPNFSKRITTSLYGSEVRDTAKRCISLLGEKVGSNCRSFSGDCYDLYLQNGVLTVFSKKGNQELLKAHAQNLTGTLSPEDVIRFRKIKDVIEVG